MKKMLPVKIYVGTIFLVVGVLFYPYQSIDLGIAFFGVFGLNLSEAGDMAVFVTPIVLLLAVLSSISYSVYFLYKQRRHVWQCYAELVISIFVLLQLPVY